MADSSGKENEEASLQLGSMGSCSLFTCIGGLQVDSRPNSAAPSLSSSPLLSSYPSDSLDSALSLGSRLPSLELPFPISVGRHKACAKQLNMRLMHSSSAQLNIYATWHGTVAAVQEIFDLAFEHMDAMDAINLSAAFQRLARFSEGAAAKESVLSAPLFQTMAEMLVDECNAGRFNSQSTSNAWWAISKLVPSSHPLSGGLLRVLETALLGCLSSPTEGERPNSQAVSRIFYAWSRLDGYLPSTRVLNLMWDRALRLALSFDTKGVANVVWALGVLKKKHGDAFAIRADVLSALSFLVQRTIPAFAVQSLSCAAIGCANMGPSLRCSVGPMMECIIAESLNRPTQFTLQAMASLVCAISRVGHTLTQLPQTQMLLAAFDVHAASLPPPHKPQELYTLHSSMVKCGRPPRCFPLPSASMNQHERCTRQGMGLPPSPPPPLQQVLHPQDQGCALLPSQGATAQMEAAALQAAALAAAHSQQALAMLPTNNSLLLAHHQHQALHQAAAAAATAACMAGSYASPFATAQPTASGFLLAGYPAPGMGLAFPMQQPVQPPMMPPMSATHADYPAAVRKVEPLCQPLPPASAAGRQVDLQAILSALQAIKLQWDQLTSPLA